MEDPPTDKEEDATSSPSDTETEEGHAPLNPPPSLPTRTLSQTSSSSSRRYERRTRPAKSSSTTAAGVRELYMQVPLYTVVVPSPQSYRPYQHHTRTRCFIFICMVLSCLVLLIKVPMDFRELEQRIQNAATEEWKYFMPTTVVGWNSSATLEEDGIVHKKNGTVVHKHKNSTKTKTKTKTKKSTNGTKAHGSSSSSGGSRSKKHKKKKEEVELSHGTAAVEPEKKEKKKEDGSYDPLDVDDDDFVGLEDFEHYEVDKHKEDKEEDGRRFFV